MSQQYREDDGMDPGLGDLAYDGTEYELDEFGERIGADELSDDMPEEAMSEDDMRPTNNVEAGFAETLNTESLDDQFEDEALRKEAESEYKASEPDTPQQGT